MRLLVLGIDSAEYEILKRIENELPNLSQLTCKLERYYTTVPPITVPAWLTLFSGLNPGWLGLYDVKYRVPGTYTEFRLYNRNLVSSYRFLWDLVSESGRGVILCFVPGSTPPPHINGVVVGDFFVPDVSSPDFVYPVGARRLIAEALGAEEYIIDVPGYKRMDPRKLFSLLLRKIDLDMKIFLKLLRHVEWSLAICVLMSIDRAQHTLWKYFDKAHPRFVEDPELEAGLTQLYKRVDYWFGKLLEVVPRDTAFVLMSDHGAKPMYLRVNINEVLIREGFLKLRERPTKPLTLQDADKRGLIDWDRTTAWGWGAYVGQIWINLKGREPRGTVSREEYEDICRQIGQLLEKITSPDGTRLDNKVFYKWEIYRGTRTRYMPDITIYFHNLHYGVNTMIGLDDLYSVETEVGADDCNHGEYGIFVTSLDSLSKPRTAEEVFQVLKTIVES